MLLSGLNSWGPTSSLLLQELTMSSRENTGRVGEERGKGQIIQIQFLFIKFSKIKLEKKANFSQFFHMPTESVIRFVLQWYHVIRRHYDLFLPYLY